MAIFDNQRSYLTRTLPPRAIKIAGFETARSDLATKVSRTPHLTTLARNMSLLDTTVSHITPADEAARQTARSHIENLTMPHWALGQICDLAVDLAGMTGSINPSVTRKAVLTMAGDHGVAEEGVSAFPQEVTMQMIANFVSGGAAVNVFARQAGAENIIVDMGVAGDLSAFTESGQVIDKKVALGTANFAKGPAMSREQAITALEGGIEVVTDSADQFDVYGVGEMGIANTTASTAIVAAITGQPVASLTGRGTGLNDDQLKHKIAMVEQALAINTPDSRDALDILSKVGGFEIAGITGAILGCAALKKPVIVDGFIATAAALIAQLIKPESADYMIAAHRSVEQGHVAMQDVLNKTPLLDLNMRLGEGTGSALAMHMVEAAARMMTEMATFADAAVSESHAE